MKLNPGNIKKQPDIILAVLPTAIDQAMTAAEIFAALDPADQGRIGSAANVSKLLSQLRTRGKNVANGLSEIVGGATKLTWYRNEAPKKLDETDPQPIEPVAAEPTPHLDPVQIEVAQEQDQSPSDHPTLSTITETALETLVRDGYMVLDPISESDQFICEVVNRLKTPCPQIKNKAEKIGVLNLMRDHYGYINTDFETVLSDIIQDLKQLEEAA